MAPTLASSSPSREVVDRGGGATMDSNSASPGAGTAAAYMGPHNADRGPVLVILRTVYKVTYVTGRRFGPILWDPRYIYIYIYGCLCKSWGL